MYVWIPYHFHIYSMLSADWDSFIFFSNLSDFISFSCLVAKARIPSSVFNKGDAHLAFILVLKGKDIQSFTSKYDFSCRFFVHTLC